MNIKVAIQCVPQRAKHVGIIKKYIESIGLECNYYMDFERKGCLWNFKRILSENVNNKETYLLFLQDDIFFNEDFKHHLGNIIEHMSLNEIDAVSLFCPPRGYYIKAFDSGQKFYIEKNFLWMQSVIFSKNYIKGLLDFKNEVHTRHDDSFVSMYAKETENYIQIALPSLIQHDLEIKSAMGHPKKTGNVERKSNLFTKIKLNHFKTNNDE